MTTTTAIKLWDTALAAKFDNDNATVNLCLQALAEDHGMNFTHTDLLIELAEMGERP